MLFRFAIWDKKETTDARSILKLKKRKLLMTTQTHSSIISDSVTTTEAKVSQQPSESTTPGSKEKKPSINEHQGFHQVFLYWDERP